MLLSKSSPLVRSIFVDCPAKGILRRASLLPASSSVTVTGFLHRFSSLALEMTSSSLYEPEPVKPLASNQKTNDNRSANGLRKTVTSNVELPTSTDHIIDVEDLHFQALRECQSSYIDPETGFTVFSELFHLQRGTCCGNQCRHCPYGYESVSQRVKNAMREASISLPVARCQSGDKETTQQLVKAIFDGKLDLWAEKTNTSTNPNTATITSSQRATSTTKDTINPASVPAAAKQTQTSRILSTTTTKNVPYTRKGDTGTSQLGTGERRSKCDCNFEALGTVDELCTVVGVAHAHLLFAINNQENKVDYGTLPERLLDVMSRLFDLGSHVAKPRVGHREEDNGESEGAAPSVKFQPNGIGDGFDAVHIDDLENWINEMTEELPELRSFVLPTGAVGAAQLHVARTVCRRAERRVVPLVVEEGTCDPNALRYLNRLSDFFFVAARWVNYCEGQEEIEYRRESTETKQRERVHRTLK